MQSNCVKPAIGKLETGRTDKFLVLNTIHLNPLPAGADVERCQKWVEERHHVNATLQQQHPLQKSPNEIEQKTINNDNNTWSGGIIAMY